MISFIDNLGIENIVYGIVAVAGLVAVVYCTFFTSTDEDRSIHDDSNLIDDIDSSDDSSDD